MNELVARKTTAVFGTTFAEAWLLLTPASWQEPVESGLGWHVVWVESITHGHTSSFSEIVPDIKSSWNEEQHNVSKRLAFDAIKAQYEVVLPNAPTMNDILVNTTETK